MNGPVPGKQGKEQPEATQSPEDEKPTPDPGHRYLPDGFVGDYYKPIGENFQLELKCWNQ
jgi:hypothetical protein